MHSTKTEILALLKRSDGSTVDELASHLQLAPMTVRQHLMVLERDELVAAEEVRRPTGRPHYRFRLTDDGHRKVSGGHDRLLDLLVEQAGHLEPADVAGATPDERRAHLFRSAAESLATRHRAEVAVLSGVEQVERVAAILRAHGGFPDFHDLGGEFELRDFSCVFRSSVGPQVPCAWHEVFLTVVLAASVRAAVEPAAGADCCRYIVPIAARKAASIRGR
jgi:predicted ArsR family transcriptional regulator